MYASATTTEQTVGLGRRTLPRFRARTLSETIREILWTFKRLMASYKACIYEDFHNYSTPASSYIPSYVKIRELLLFP
jgi:hypothetical protein